MFTKRIGTGSPILLAALLLGASGLAGCASKNEGTAEPYGAQSESYPPAGESYYGGRFEKEPAGGESSQGSEAGEYEGGPWGSEEGYGETGAQKGQSTGVYGGETGVGESETGMQEGETDTSKRRNPFDRDF